MKISNPLDKILDSEVKIKILRFLIKTSAQWNGRQIAKEIGVTPATTHKALQELYKEGTLRLINAGKTHLYNLNKNSYLVSELLKPLFAREEKAMGKIIDIIKRRIRTSRAKGDIISVSLFGSVGMRKDHPASDIDLAVIIRDRQNVSRVEALFEEIDKKISSEFGNTVSPYINTEAEFRTKYNKGLPVIKNILKSSKLIYGKDIKALL